MTSETEFRPNWAAAPGDTIADLLAERHIAPAAFAELIGYDDARLNGLLRGRVEIGESTARMLQERLGGSVTFWLNRERHYRRALARTGRRWLDRLPVNDMIQFGWINRERDPQAQVDACLRFFAVPDENAWQQAYGVPLELAAFRTSASFESHPGAVATWLRQGELEAKEVDCKPWNADRFSSSLSTVRKLTRLKEPGRFIPELVKLCALSGVAIVVLRAPDGCRASGATRFLSQDKALLLLSFRYLSDDHFWFTLFHEAGHLLLHGQDDLFLEGADLLSSVQEQEANDFAEEVLIPKQFQADFDGLPTRYIDIIRFARRIGIAPGIVVGQLQHKRRIGPHQLNRAKRRFSWS
jgi:plasmid maintenance system antidote protein VapI